MRQKSILIRSMDKISMYAGRSKAHKRICTYPIALLYLYAQQIRMRAYIATTCMNVSNACTYTCKFHSHVHASVHQYNAYNRSVYSYVLY